MLSQRAIRTPDRACHLQQGVNWSSALALLMFALVALVSTALKAQDPQSWLEIVRTDPTQNPSRIKKILPVLPVFDGVPGKPLSDSTTELREPENRFDTEEVFSGDSTVPLTQHIDMFVGEVRMLGRVDVKRVAVGRGSVVKVNVLDEGDLVVIAEAVGSSSVRLWHRNGKQSDFNIRVLAEDPEPRYRAQQMITMRVKMVEFRKSALRELGIDWSDRVEGPTLGTSSNIVEQPLFQSETSNGALQGVTLPSQVRSLVGYAGLTSSLTSKINLMSVTGDALLLAEPVLSCASGESASFLAGGELPYATTDASGQNSVAFKEYGIKLDIDPRIDVNGRVQASITTEISSIDPAVAVQGAPGLLTRRAQTQVTVGNKQTIVIAGLLQEQKGADENQVPLLGRLPLLGGLFRSKHSRNTISELVIFITPEIEPILDNLTPRRQQQYEKIQSRLSTIKRGKLLDLLD